MARKTDGEKVDELQKAVVAFEIAPASLAKEVKDHDLHRAGQRFAVVESDVADLKKWREESRRLGWSIVIPVLSAILGAVLGYILKR